LVGAHRFRDPDEDLPGDYAERRSSCYERLGLPLDAKVFIAAAKTELKEALAELDRTMARNPKVRLNPRRRHPISVTPRDAQPEPPNLEAIRNELGKRWPMIGLLDILKEADLRIRFTDAFSTSATREATEREEVRRRLLLCLYGLGTNAGLKRLAVGDHGFSHKELPSTRSRSVPNGHFAQLRGHEAHWAVLSQAPFGPIALSHSGWPRRPATRCRAAAVCPRALQPPQSPLSADWGPSAAIGTLTLPTCIPPSTTITWPVMYRDSGEARKQFT
jgi:hypothetical protein